MQNRGGIFRILALWLALGTSGLQAHPAQFTRFDLSIKPDGSFEASLNIDLLAFALGETSSTVKDADLQKLLDGPRPALAEQLADAGARFRREVVVRTDRGNVRIPEAGWTLPNLATVEEVLTRGIIPRTVMPGEIRLTGKLPPGARSLSVRLPYVLGDTVHFYEWPGGDGASEPVAAGAFSSTFRFGLAARPVPAYRAFGNYVWLGFEHILPKGLDHILFVLGLYLLSPKIRPLLWQVSAFTLAHSLTLALSIYGVISLPASTVEPIIAASIVFIALENVFTSGLHAWRPIVVFVFGLLHGLGFAGVLTGLGLPESARLTALFGFNVGVELGQCAVIALAFLTVGWFGRKTWYRSRIVVPASLLIAAVALVWTVERLPPARNHTSVTQPQMARRYPFKVANA